MFPEDLGGHSEEGPTSIWALREFQSLHGVNDACLGAGFFYASSDMQSSDVLQEFSRTSQAYSTSSTEVGPFSADPKTSNTEALHRTIAHVSLRTATSEVLMRQITSFLHFPPHWASGSGLGFFGTFFIRWTFFLPYGWRHY